MGERILFYLVLTGILLSFGCHLSPPENEIRSQIIKYFETRHYKVIDIDIGAIESIPQREKVYMGTEGYVVRINSITLEAEKNNPQLQYKEGQRLIYKNGSIRIKKNTGQLQEWIITDVANIPVL
jgi:hypothetical protein